MLTIKTEPTIEDFLAFNWDMGAFNGGKPNGEMLLKVRKRKQKKAKFSKVTLNGINFDARRPPVGRFERLAALYTTRLGDEISPFEDGSADTL